MIGEETRVFVGNMIDLAISILSSEVQILLYMLMNG